MAHPRAAVVIGVGTVDSPGLQPLQSAAPLAAELANWLAQSERYDIALLTDAKGPVTASDVEEAISRFVTEPPRYRQLLVYFIGHGLWHGRADRWLLSRAAQQSSQAVNLHGAMEMARYSGIPNVIFVSDACRSLPANFSQANVQGTDAFPSLASIVTPSKVDVFKATSDARPAYEVPVPGGTGRTSVLTWALRRAFAAPEQDMVATVTEGGKTIDVVPNRRLERYLQETVDDVLAMIDPDLSQHIEAIVPSADHVYLARVSGAPLPPKPRGGRRRGGGERAAPQSAIERTDDLLAAADLGLPLPNVPAELLPAPAIGHFESQCGLTVRGVGLLEVLSWSEGGRTTVDLLERGGPDRVAVARIDPASHAGSLLLRFDDARGAVVPFFSGFITHVTVTEAGVSQVAFVPSDNHPRWQAYSAQRERIDALRAALAAVINAESFVLSTDAQARQLANSIRGFKHLDPSLGLFAAHAYAQAGLLDHVGSVARYLREDLGVGLFDVELLALPRGSTLSTRHLAPFCPLLSQTWSLLRARNVELPEFLRQAQAHLRNALWTSFEPEGVEVIARAMHRTPADYHGASA